MSEDGDSGSTDEGLKLTEADVARDIEEKCYKAFIKFDSEGRGREVRSD